MSSDASARSPRTPPVSAGGGSREQRRASQEFPAGPQPPLLLLLPSPLLSTGLTQDPPTPTLSLSLSC